MCTSAASDTLNYFSTSDTLLQEVLRNSNAAEAGTSNVHGDKQLEVDIAADMLIFAKLRECGAVETASSEETAEIVDLGGHGFCVRFYDPGSTSSYPDLASGIINWHTHVMHSNIYLRGTGMENVLALVLELGGRSPLVPAMAGDNAFGGMSSTRSNLVPTAASPQTRILRGKPVT